MKFKKRIFQIIEPASKGDHASVRFDVFINTIIFLSVIFVVLETYQEIVDMLPKMFIAVNALITLIFVVEYTLRIWTADLKYPGVLPKKARRTYIKSAYGLIDLIAILPLFTRIIFGVNLAVLRILRLVRILRMNRFEKLNNSLLLLIRVFGKKRDELTMVFSLVFILIFIASILMYYVENTAQPEIYTNASDAIWWAVITLTTVGYGDIYPVTSFGRFMGGIIALLGIGVIALPTGILSGGLMEELDERKNNKKKNHSKKCPHCGKRYKHEI